MKGIILAGGAGTRLYPASLPISKILLPIYDKPMIYYPLAVLMQAGITDILVITNPEDDANFKKLLGNGAQWGVSILYKIQHEKRGIADAFLLGEDFIGKDSCALILGDNVFYGKNLAKTLLSAVQSNSAATVFAYEVADPQRFGVVEFDGQGHALSLEEKPKNPKSNFAVTGLYFYDNQVVSFAKKLTPSKRGELEITDLNKMYLAENRLNVVHLGQEFTWLDTGTYESIFQANVLVREYQEQEGKMVACLEEIAIQKKLITADSLRKSSAKWPDNAYYNYLRDKAIN